MKDKKARTGKKSGKAAQKGVTGKRWDPAFEEPIRAGWRKEQPFRFDLKKKGKIFSIDTPPPYVNAPVHMGHAVTYTIMDFIARFKRMTGHNVLFPLGLDRNGLPIEMAAQKKYGVSIEKSTREEFVAACKKILEEMTTKSIDTFYRLGHTYNTWDVGTGLGEIYQTDSDDYRKMTQSTFIDLWNRGLIKKDKRVSNYCPACQTTIADAEIGYKDFPSEFVHVKWKVRETGKELVIATTRPELICSCSMVVYNPEDERYRNLEGKHAVLPLYGREVPIKAHPLASIEKGSGLMMMCSFGDYADILFYRDMKLKPIISIGKNGRMNRKAGFLKNLKIGEARAEIKKRLDKQGLIVKKERINHRTPICERSKDPLEFIELDEYYLESLDWKTSLKKDVVDKTSFFAPKSKQLLLDWMNALSMDWAISRRRVYATEIPLWYCRGCGEIIVPPKGRYYQPWREDPPVKACPKCGAREFRGEERVFDTWFDSSISPVAILGYDHDSRFFRKTMPCSLRPQGKDIIRTWLYYTLLRSYQLTKKPIFENIWIHQHVVDEKGKKMSKSLGNTLDPKEVIDRFGAETFRLWCALEGDITTIDLRCSFERIESAGKFLTKLWNVARFVSSFGSPKGAKTLQPLDRWILTELNELIGYTRKKYDVFDFHKPVTRIKNFVWEMFASHYLELAKNRAYNQSGVFTRAEQNAAIYTLNHVLDTVLLLLSPVACSRHRREQEQYRVQDMLQRVYGSILLCPCAHA
ncbi:MAG: valine--tRNA ligase [Candidatus Aenigmarchaeota archaeon]|nr:valine--tRNA ligase [Candidatus Aenigmarchaeota archaeon]